MLQKSLNINQKKMGFSSLTPFLLITFGLAWGIFSLFILLPEQMTRMFGEITGQHPLFFLAVWTLGMAVFVVVPHRAGFSGLKHYLCCKAGSGLFVWLFDQTVKMKPTICPSHRNVYKVPSPSASQVVLTLLLSACLVCGWLQPAAAALDATLIDRIDTFVESERQASGIPGIALAIIEDGDSVHLRGFGQDGRGNAISADTPFPIGSLTKSFTALLVRQAIDTGRLDGDAPVQRYLPWFRVADADASARITLRHLLNQTSGFSRADGIAPLLKGSTASIEELARGLVTVSLNRPVGERFEYSNLNFVLLGAVLQAVTGRSWQELVQAQVLQPLQMARSYTEHDAARQAGMTAVHRMWFGVPVTQEVSLLPGFAPTGSLVASVGDMGRYLQMLLADGATPTGRVVSAEGVAHLLAPASPPGHSKLLSADFQFRYGEGWFVGSFGVAADARWHLGSLASFAAWMVLLPDTRQAVVVLINANTELPFGGVNATISRLPIGVVNLLRGQPAPLGPSLRRAYLPFNTVAALVVVGLAVQAWWAARTRRAVWSVALLLIAIAMAIALQIAGLNAAMLTAFAPDFALVVAVVVALLCVAAAWRAGVWAHRALVRSSEKAQR
jgi:CubicO group peptidase (beta-lactamase class C family)